MLYMHDSNTYINYLKRAVLIVALISINSVYGQYRGEQDCSQAAFMYDGHCYKDFTCFTDVSIADPDGVGLNIVKWEWDFNTDGTIDYTSLVPGYSPCTVYPLPGTYTASLYITNDALPPCIDTFSLLVTIYDPVEFSLSAENISCSGAQNGSIDIVISSGTANYNYYWSDSLDNFTDSLKNEISDSIRVAGLGPSSYFVSVTDLNGCSDTASIDIVEPDSLIGNVVQLDTILCNGDSTASLVLNIIGGTPPYTYNVIDTLQDTLYNNTSSILGDTVNALPAGFYIVSVLDSNGCAWEDSINVAEPTALDLSLNMDSSVSCNGGNNGVVVASFSGGSMPYSGTWTDSSQNNVQAWSSLAIMNDTLSGLSEGVYFFSLTDSLGCQIDDSIQMSEADSLLVNAGILDSLACYGDNNGSLALSIVGGTSPYFIEWSDSQIIQNVGPIYSGADSLFGLKSGMYYYEVTDTNGCVSQDSILLFEPDSLILQLSSDTVICFGDSTATIYVQNSGGTLDYNYQWSHGLSYSNSLSTDTVSGLWADVYTLSVTDNNGCQIVDSVEVLENDEIQIQLFGQDANCGNSDGLAWVVANGGVQPYSYQWDGGLANTLGDTIYNLDAGVYTLVLTDSNGCQDSASVLVSDDPAPTIDSLIIKNVSCHGLSDASLLVQFTSIGGDSFYLSGPSIGLVEQDTGFFDSLGVGFYYIAVKDLSDCYSYDSFTITQPPLLLPPDSILINDTVCVNELINISATQSIGASTYYWTFSGNVTLNGASLDSNNVSITPLDTGLLDICVASRDSCGLSAFLCKTVYVLGAPDPPVGIIGDLIVCENTPYVYSVNPVLGISDYHWIVPQGTTITNGQGTASIEVIFTTGSLGGNICVQSVNSCDSSVFYCEGVVVYSNPVMPGNIFGAINVCEGDTHTYYINPVLGAASYAWTYPPGCTVYGQSDQDSITLIWGGAAGQVCVASVNVCGQSVSQCINVANPSIGSIGPITAQSVPYDSVCVGQTVTYLVSPVSGASTYVWDVPNVPEINILTTSGNTITIEFLGSFSSETISVYAYNSCDTTIASTIDLYSGLAPIADFLLPTDMCSGEVVDFIDQSTDALSWDWDFGDSGAGSNQQNPSYVYNSGGSYNVSLVVYNGACVDSVTKTLNIFEIPVLQIQYDDSCARDSIAFSFVSNGGAPISNIVWDFGDTPDIGDSAFVTAPSYYYNDEGQYSVILEVEDDNGCQGLAFLNLNVYSIDVDAFQYQGIYAGQSADIYATSTTAISFQWTPATSLSDASIYDPVATPDSTTTYTVQVQSIEGCLATDTVTIFIDHRRQIFMPTAFTPNGDGKNDYYTMSGNGICDFELTIFNRWGEKVFFTTDINEGWDGTYKGQKQGVEKYTALIRGEFCDGTPFGPGYSLPTDPPSNPKPGNNVVECVGSFYLFR